MKTIFVAFAISVIGVTMDRADAQPATISSPGQNATAPGLNYVTGTNENGAASFAVNTRAIKNFQKAFHDVKNESWSGTSDGGYVAQFTSNFIKTVAAYNSRGVWQYTMRYYDEKKLPRDVKSTVKSTYYDYDILGGIEVLFEDQDVYLVYLQDEESEKTVRVNDEGATEIQSFKRQ